MEVEELDVETLAFFKAMNEITTGLIIIGDRVAEMESRMGDEPTVIPEIVNLDEYEKAFEAIHKETEELYEEVRRKIERS